MTLKSFQTTTAKQRKHEPKCLQYCMVRLSEEVGEVAAIARRIAVRQHTVKSLTPLKPRGIEMKRLTDEMGDVLHSLSKLADAAGLSLEEIAAQSLKKQKA